MSRKSEAIKAELVTLQARSNALQAYSWDDPHPQGIIDDLKSREAKVLTRLSTVNPEDAVVIAGLQAEASTMRSIAYIFGNAHRMLDEIELQREKLQKELDTAADTRRSQEHQGPIPDFVTSRKDT
jgi:hypothetical protein